MDLEVRACDALAADFANSVAELWAPPLPLTTVHHQGVFLQVPGTVVRLVAVNADERSQHFVTVAFDMLSQVGLCAETLPAFGTHVRLVGRVDDSVLSVGFHTRERFAAHFAREGPFSCVNAKVLNQLVPASSLVAVRTLIEGTLFRVGFGERLNSHVSVYDEPCPVHSRDTWWTRSGAQRHAWAHLLVFVHVASVTVNELEALIALRAVEAVLPCMAMHVLG